jgi:intracellular multiplication protein IcmV
MAVKDVFKVTRKTFFNPSGWFGYDSFKQNTSNVWKILQSVITPVTSTSDVEQPAPATFEEAMERNHMTPQAVEELSKDYLLYTFVFLLLVAVSVYLSFYLLLDRGAFAGFLVGIAVALLFGVQAFRYHFWYFQIKQRKLGGTFAEWWLYVTRRSGLKP